MKRLCLLIVVITLLGISLPLALYGTFILIGDFSVQQIPFIIETKKMLSSGVPFWSWNQFIGDNFIGGYSFYTITSPFVWINSLFPYKYILTGITFTLFLKFLCLGCFSYLYLRKMHVSKPYSIIGGLLYAFSSFAICNLVYYHFLEPMMCFPLLLIAIEKYLLQERYSCLILGLAAFLVSFINYYFLPCSLIPALIYTVFRMRASDIHISAKRFICAIFIILIGVGISSFILLPTILYMRNNAGASMTTDIIGLISPYNIVERFRTLFFPKLYEGPNSLMMGTLWGSNAANIPVIGILCAVLYSIKYNDWIKWVIITCFVFYLTPLNGFFSLFTMPAYSRWVYALTLFVILASMRFLDAGNRITTKEVILYGIFALGSIFLVYLLRFLHPTLETAKEDIIFNGLIFVLALISFCFLFFYSKHSNTQILIMCISILVVIHMQAYFFKRSDLNPYAESYLSTYILDNNLERTNDEVPYKYRTDFVTRSLNIYPNVCMIKNRAGISTYNSCSNNKVRNLLVAADSTHFRVRMYLFPNKNLQEFDALMSVKDIIVYKDSLQQAEPRTWGVNKRSFDGYDIMENKYYIPMGFTYDHYVSDAKIENVLLNDSVNVPMQLLANLSVKDEDIPFVSQYLKEGHLEADLPVDSVVNERRRVVCSSFNGDTRGFTATVDMDRDNMLFFSVPSDDGFTAYVDGKPTKIYEANLGLSAIFVNAGHHDIKFSFIPCGLKEGIAISLLCLVLLLVVSWLTQKKCNETKK